MNVSIVHCRRKCKCAYCPEEITVGQPMVVGIITYGLSKNYKTKWKKVLHWHPKCWLEQGLARLEREPYISNKPGRPKRDLDPVTKQLRLSALMRRASIIQRIRKLTESGNMDLKTIDKIVHLGEMLDKIKEEMVNLGGVPSKWLKD